MTVLLVTHFMEEAHRLCDRIAVIDKGRVAALDSPAGLIGRSAASTVISFTPSHPLDDRELAALPEAASVETHGGRVVINGTDATVNAVITLLARHRVTARQLRVTEATLDDAFLDLTGTAPATESAAEVAAPSAEPAAPTPATAGKTTPAMDRERV